MQPMGFVGLSERAGAEVVECACVIGVPEMIKVKLCTPITFYLIFTKW